MKLKVKKLVFGKSGWTLLVQALVFIYLGLVIVACSLSNNFIYHPPRPSYTEEKKGISRIPLENGDKIAVSYLPPYGGKPTLLWAHGNSEDIGQLRARHMAFHRLGYGVLAYDYPGYGLSDGEPSEQGCYDAAMASWKYLTEELGVKNDNVVIYGQSVGSGPSTWLATQVDAKALVLVSPFTSTFRVVTKIPLFPFDQFPNINRIKDVSEPMLVIHGSNDKIVPQWHGKKLYDLHAGEKTWFGIDGVRHNDIFHLARKDIIASLEKFLKEKANQKPQKFIF